MRAHEKMWAIPIAPQEAVILLNAGFSAIIAGEETQLFNGQADKVASWHRRVPVDELIGWVVGYHRGYHDGVEE